MSVSPFTLTFVLAACISWSPWQGVSSSRLLRAPNTPELPRLGPAPRHPVVTQAPLSGALRHTYSSPNPVALAPKPPGLVDVVLLNGGAMVLPAANLSYTSPDSTTDDSSDTGQPPTATAPLSGSRSGNSTSAAQPAPVSKDGIILMALIGMLILALAAGIDRDGPTSLFLASVKRYVASVSNRVWCGFATFNTMLWSSVLAVHQHTIGSAATALQQLTMLIDSALAACKAAGHCLVLASKSVVSAVQSRMHHWQDDLAHGMGITAMPVCEIRQRQGQQQQKLEPKQGAVDPQQLSAAGTAAGSRDSCSCIQCRGSNSNCISPVVAHSIDLDLVSARAPCALVDHAVELCSCEHVVVDGTTAP